MARSPSLLGVCLLVGLGICQVLAGTAPKHVYFTQRADIYTTQSQWVMGFTIDLGSYGAFLGQVRANINVLDWLVGKAIETAGKYPSPNKVYQKFFRNQQLDLQSIWDGYNFCVSRYEEIRHLSDRVG